MRAVNAALGARSGTATIGHVMPGNAGATQSIVGDGDYSVTTVDALGLEQLDFLKIAFDAHPLTGLEGAGETLRRNRPLVWAALREQLGEGAAGDAALQALGYARLAAPARNGHLHGPA